MTIRSMLSSPTADDVNLAVEILKEKFGRKRTFDFICKFYKAYGNYYILYAIVDLSRDVLDAEPYY